MATRKTRGGAPGRGRKPAPRGAGVGTSRAVRSKGLTGTGTLQAEDDPSQDYSQATLCTLTIGFYPPRKPETVPEMMFFLLPKGQKPGKKKISFTNKQYEQMLQDPEDQHVLLKHEGEWYKFSWKDFVAPVQKWHSLCVKDVNLELMLMLTCFSVLWQLNLQEYQEAGVDSAMLADQFYNMLDSFKVNDGFKTPPGKGFRMTWYHHTIRFVFCPSPFCLQHNLEQRQDKFLVQKGHRKESDKSVSSKNSPNCFWHHKKREGNGRPYSYWRFLVGDGRNGNETLSSSSAGSSTSSLSRSGSTSSAASSPKNPSITQTFVGSSSNQTKVVASPTTSRVQSPSSRSLVLGSNTAPVPMIIIAKNEDKQETPVVHDQAADTKSKQTSTDVEQEELEEPDEESDEEEGEPTEQQEEKHDKPEEQEWEQGEEQKPSAPVGGRRRGKRQGKKTSLETQKIWQGKSLASRADERDNRDTKAVNIQQKTIQSERKQGESLTESEKTHLRIRMNHEVGKFEIFYKRFFRASPAWQTRPLNSNQVKSLVGKIKENRFENLPPAYVYPVMLTTKCNQSIGLIDEGKFVQPFWNDPLNYTQFSTIQQFQEATAGLIPERKVTENTQLAWPTDQVKRTYSNAKHQDGIAALKEALATDPKLAHPLLCFNISQKAAMHRWKEDDFATVLKLRSELLDLVPKDEEDRDVYLRSLVGNNTI
eukprot:g19814.t1